MLRKMANMADRVFILTRNNDGDFGIGKAKLITAPVLPSQLNRIYTVLGKFMEEGTVLTIK